MKKNLLAATIICMLSLGIFSCGQQSKSLEKAAVISTEQFYKNLEDLKNNGKRFAIEAYPSLGGMRVYTEENKLHEIYFASQAAGHGYKYLKTQLPFAKAKNSFYLPETFTDETISLFDNDGKEHIGKKVLVSFTLKLDEKSEKRTRVFAGDIIGGDKPITIEGYDAEFTDVRIDAANQ